MRQSKQPEDKQVLIDPGHSYTENCDPYPDPSLPTPNQAQDDPSDPKHLRLTPPSCEYVEVPLSSSQQEPFSEYSYPKVTFQPLSDPIDPSPPTLRSRDIFPFFLNRLRRLSRYFFNLRNHLQFHKRLYLSCLLVTLGSSGCLIFFPLHLENVSRVAQVGSFDTSDTLDDLEGFDSSGGPFASVGISDGYSACLCAATLTTLLFLFNCVLLEMMRMYKGSQGDVPLSLKYNIKGVLRPLITWRSGVKVGFCLGLSFVTIFYSWEDDKVPCNFQDPLLGLVIIFAIITHAVCRWKSIGLKRTFALSTIASGVFLSVDYPLVDHHRCRGYYYRNQMGDLWTWKVHLVWTLAFVTSIWLATVAAFFLESAVPVPKVKHSRLYDLEYNAVKLRVMSKTSRPSNLAPDFKSTHLKSYRYNPYASFNMGLISNAVLWFGVGTWAFILALFWTEFIPGFGKGISVEKLPSRVLSGFLTSLTTGSSWALFFSLFIFSHSFTYLTVLTRSPICSICVSMLGFPIIGLWWSFFQIRYSGSLFVWMPVFSGELICSCLGFISVIIGCYYFIQLEILKPAKVNKRTDVYAQHF